MCACEMNKRSVARLESLRCFFALSLSSLLGEGKGRFPGMRCLERWVFSIVSAPPSPLSFMMRERKKGAFFCGFLVRFDAALLERKDSMMDLRSGGRGS